MKLTEGVHVLVHRLVGVWGKVDECLVCSMEERIEAFGLMRGVKLWNCIFGGSSLHYIFTTLFDLVSFDLPLLLPFHASKISILIINYSARANNSVIESE